jgi:hypothetical protein
MQDDVGSSALPPSTGPVILGMSGVRGAGAGLSSMSPLLKAGMSSVGSGRDVSARLRAGAPSTLGPSTSAVVSEDFVDAELDEINGSLSSYTLSKRSAGVAGRSSNAIISKGPSSGTAAPARTNPSPASSVREGALTGPSSTLPGLRARPSNVSTSHCLVDVPWLSLTCAPPLCVDFHPCRCCWTSHVFGKYCNAAFDVSKRHPARKRSAAWGWVQGVTAAGLTCLRHTLR